MKKDRKLSIRTTDNVVGLITNIQQVFPFNLLTDSQIAHEILHGAAENVRQEELTIQRIHSLFGRRGGQGGQR
jgi:hypothetical protein